MWLDMAVIDGCPYPTKRVWLVSSARSSSIVPVGQNLPRSYQTLGRTPLGTSGAEKTWKTLSLIALLYAAIKVILYGIRAAVSNDEYYKYILKYCKDCSTR